MADQASRRASLGPRQRSRSERSPRPAGTAKAAAARRAFPIAVVGASAGGLEALRRLLSVLPEASGVGFIVIPHLDPTLESRMAGLLGAASSLPVAAAENGLSVRADHVYVIPPNRLLEVHGGRLVLRPLPHPHAARTVLDLALRSLAADQGSNAVGIILSGTGSHGAAGVREILDAGGLALAQDPATALYDQMPRAAAAAGVTPRHILAPEGMAPVLLARARQPARGGRRRVTTRSLSARFFHDADALDALAAEALPKLVTRASAARPVRVWIPQCGTGEDAYSVAMLLLERLDAAGKHAALKVFATDSDPKSLRVARGGVYPESIARIVSRERLERFFHPAPMGQYQVAHELRETVVFGQVDLLADPPISNLDLLVWREPSRKLRPEEEAALIARLHFASSCGGYLLLGPGAPDVAASGLFQAVSEQALLYRRNGPAPREHCLASRPARRPEPLESAAGFMNHALLERLAPAAILMNARYRILATRGPVTKYLRIAPGMPLPSLHTAADAGLRAATRSACEEASRDGRWVRRVGNWTKRDGRYLRCTVSARSLRERASGRRFLLVLFEDDGPGRRPFGHPHADVARKSARVRLLGEAAASRHSLRAVLADLQHANDDLAASNEQITTMNEELRAANEELQSSNEELQSSNEELQSSNEEMQAMNEELHVSKISLQESIEAGERIEAQLRAVLDATVDAVVTINADGNIVTFNGSASRMFGYALHEVIGRNVNMLLPPESRALHDEYLARYRSTHQRHVIGTSREVVAYRRDGTRFPALLSVSETDDTDLLVGCLRDLTADKALQEEVLHIAALEQQRIGQELHDGTQQELTGLGLLAQNLSDELKSHGASQADLAKRLAAGIAEASLHVRSLARGLVAVPVDAETLPEALGELARSTQETFKLACRFECAAPVKLPDTTTATHLYRVAQEAVGNAVKHSGADAVVIRLASHESQLRLEIQDDGIGLPARPPLSGGVGLRLMEHRCTAIGGRFRIEPRAGGGTVVCCTVPFLLVP